MTTPVRVNPSRADIRSSNSVLTARTHSYHEPGFRTTLSVKSVLRGEARYGTHRGRYRVTPEVFAVFGRGQRYTLDIDSLAVTETCAVFFAPGFVDGALDAKERTPRSLLDDPAAPTRDAEFVDRLYPKAGAPARALTAVAGAARRRDPARLEEALHELGDALVRLDDESWNEARSFPGGRASTRRETYRRLQRANDVLWSCYDEPLGVADLARHACMSPFHFLRSYRAAFGRTPVQALQARRLEVAARLLETTRSSVLDVCTAVGFSSAPSFARLFRRSFGASPSEWRRR